MEAKSRKEKVLLASVESETKQRAIIESEAQKLLIIQREGHFTFRCVDCLHKPVMVAQAMVMPCILHGQNANELGMGSASHHALLCLVSPFWIGSYLSVGKSKTTYRTQNSIPGLIGDDQCIGCCCPWCLILQLRYEMEEQKSEVKRIEELKQQALTHGMAMERA